MCKKAMILGALGQTLNERIIQRIEKAIRIAVEEYNITDFYFGNVQEECLDNLAYKKLYDEYILANEVVAEKLQSYKHKNPSRIVRSTLLVARTEDTNFKRTLFDEIIQGYPLYKDLVGETETEEAFCLRDTFLMTSVDWIFWYANRILLNQSCIDLSRKEIENKIIIVE